MAPKVLLASLVQQRVVVVGVLQEAVRVEPAQVEAARVEAVRVEPARVEAARVEAARLPAWARLGLDHQEDRLLCPRCHRRGHHRLPPRCSR